jgi:SAM-dependent methyltransferase
MKLISRLLKKAGLKSAAWDQEFKGGDWDKDTSSDPIYPVLARYHGSMLELGCGSGNTPLEAPRAAYTGVDISPEAISRARARNRQNRSIGFAVSSMERYRPSQRYDVILFRESIYYAERLPELLTYLTAFLQPKGVFVARICDRKRHESQIAEIVFNWDVKEEIPLATGGIILVFKPYHGRS